MLRKILIATALLFVALMFAGVYIFHRIESQLARNSSEQLQKLQPGVVVGSGEFKKSIFYKSDGLGVVTEILAGWPGNREDASLTIVGNLGAHFLDKDATLKKQIRFSKDVLCPIKATRLDASGEYGFLTRDESWAVDATLFDKRGLERWSYPGGALKGINDSIGGDLDGKGKFQVAVGFNAAGGVVLLDGDGKKVWQKADSNVWHLEILDINEDGRKEILHSNAQGQLVVRDASGEIISRYLSDHYVSDFALTSWGTESQARHILIPTKDPGEGCCMPVILVLDAKGMTVSRFGDPLGDLMHKTQGTPVHFSKKLIYYAVVQSNSPLKRSMFFLFDNEGKIAYQEILADACFGITSVPGESGDRLLVGCTGEVLEYSPITDGTPARPKSPANSR